MSTNLQDYDFHLPQELIATRPPELRPQSRMMVIDRETKALDIRSFVIKLKSQ